MTRSPRQQITYSLIILLAAGPFAVGFVRAFGASHDLRFLWMALAAFFGFSAVMAAGKARSRKRVAVLALTAAASVIAAALAAWVAFLLGATAAPGVWAVAVVFALCFAAGFMLDSFLRSTFGKPIS